MKYLIVDRHTFHKGRHVGAPRGKLWCISVILPANPFQSK